MSSLLNSKIEIFTREGLKISGELVAFDEFYNFYLINEDDQSQLEFIRGEIINYVGCNSINSN